MAGPRASDLRQLYKEQLAYVLRTLRRLGIRPAELEDAAHDVFVVVHRKLDCYDSQRPIRPWLFGIAFRTAAHYFERAHHRREVSSRTPERSDERPSAEEQLVDAEARTAVLSALATVDLDQRAVCILHDLDGLSAAEIARTLDIPLNTVYSRLRAGRLQWARTLRRQRLLGGDT